MSLVLSLSDPGRRPDSPASKVPFTSWARPHILGRKDLEEKHWRTLKKQHFLLSEHLRIETKVTLLSRHIVTSNLGRRLRCSSPLPSDGITAKHLVGAWVLPRPASLPALEEAGYPTAHAGWCYRLSDSRSQAPSPTLASRENVMGQNLKAWPMQQAALSKLF